MLPALLIRLVYKVIGILVVYLSLKSDGKTTSMASGMSAGQSRI